MFSFHFDERKTFILHWKQFESQGSEYESLDTLKKVL